MSIFYSLALVLFGVVNIFLAITAYSKCKAGCSFHLTRWLAPLGMFVWGDVLVLSLFWTAVSLISIVLQDILLFVVCASLFWLIRSVGETLYWFLQQFASQKRDKPETLLGYHVVKNEAIWFMYQVMWQCLTVVFSVLSILAIYYWILSLK